MRGFPKHRLGATLMLGLQDFQRRLDADLAARGVQGINAKHRKVFMHLERNGARRSVDLAAEVGVRPQSMMKTLHELEDLGLLTRAPDPHDSRAKLVKFTRAGQALIDELARSTEIVWQQYAAKVDERELERAMRVLNNLSLSADEKAGVSE